MAKIKGSRPKDDALKMKTRLPRALFPETNIHGQRQCSVCGLVVHKSNMARHRKVKHPLTLGTVKLSMSPGSPTSGSSAASSPAASELPATPEVSSPKPGVTASEGSPVAEEPVPTEDPVQSEGNKGTRDPVQSEGNKGTRDPVKLTIRLPSVEEAVQKNSDRTVSNLSSRWPSTPQSEEELHLGLARLYAKRVAENQRDSPIAYKDTSTIMCIARDPRRRGALREILHSVGLVLLTREEHDELSRKQTMKPGPAQDVAEIPQPLRVTTTHQEGEPQVVSICMGGSWGIRLSPYKVEAPSTHIVSV